MKPDGAKTIFRFACGTSLLCALGLATGITATARAELPKAFGLAADDNVAWAIARHADPRTGEFSVNFAVASLAPTSAPLNWFRMPYGPVRGRVTHMAVVNTKLFCLYSDGTILSYPYPPPFQNPAGQIEVRLPHNVIPQAVAADASGRGLWAIVPQTTAALLQTEEVHEAELVQTEEKAALERTDPDPLEDGWYLIRYNGIAWIRVGRIPLQDIAHVIGMTSKRDLLFVIFESERDGRQEWIGLAYDGEQWHERARSAKPAVQVLGVIVRGDDVALVARDAGRGGTIRTWYPHEGQWQAHDPMQIEWPEGAGEPDSVMAIALEDDVGLAWMNEASELQMGRWPAEGGPSRYGVVTLSALKGNVTWFIEPQTRRFIALALLALLLMVVFWRRRESIQLVVPLPPDFEIAPHMRRLAAFLMDAAILTLISAILTYEWWPENWGQVMLLWQDLNLNPVMRYTVWLVVCGSYVVYFSVFELLWSATPGKRIMRCRVTTDQGEPCSASRILIRNLARCIEFIPEFQLLPIVVLVLLTRNHQRLGDLLARTIVVHKVEAQAEEPASEESTDSRE